MMSNRVEFAIATTMDVIVWVNMPNMKIRLRPWISPNLPKGTKNIAAARIYELATQPNVTASSENLFPMAGSAMLTDENMKGVIKEAKVEMINTARLLTGLLSGVFTIVIIPYIYGFWGLQ